MLSTQSLEFAAQPGQSSDVVLLLMNAGSITLEVSLEPQRAELFSVTPEQCEIVPGDVCEVSVHFTAPAEPASSLYQRSDVPYLLTYH